VRYAADRLGPSQGRFGMVVDVKTTGLRQRLAIFACITAGWLSQGFALGETQVGIIQYNVKHGQGGWTTDSNVIVKQAGIIVDKVKSASVDFVALEQAGKWQGSVGLLISDQFSQEGLPGWKTIINSCNKDVTQLAYSPNWNLVHDSRNTNPLIDGLSPQRGWVPEGCEAGGNGRPYNIAYFYNKLSQIKLLFVVTHMPHCPEIATCISHWDVSQFQEDIKLVLGDTTDMQQIHLIVAGDLNELGGEGDPRVFLPILSRFGALEISPNLLTCCNDSNWIYSFDRIVTNSSQKPDAVIVDEMPYPLNPTFSGQNEEHKAIYGVVTFPLAP
jgi:hypothetical protein